jgi:1-acyl-sn-glycerol-3-phosphate acyltransferase
MYLFARFLVFPASRLLFVRRVSGVENLPACGPYIIAANHSSYIDHFLLMGIVLKHRGRMLNFLTRKEAFEGYWSNLWHVANGCVPVDRASPEIASFRAMVGLLKRGSIVVIYPEGTRSVDGTPLPPKPGVIKLGLHTGVPVVPVGIQGAHKILPKGRIVPRPARATLAIGAPLYLSERIADPKSKDAVERELHHLMGEISRLAATHGGAQALTPAALIPAASE